MLKRTIPQEDLIQTQRYNKWEKVIELMTTIPQCASFLENNELTCAVIFGIHYFHLIA